MRDNAGGLAMANASPKEAQSFMKEMETITSMPGGAEMLMSAAAQEMGQDKTKALRLYSLGGPVAFNEGGLMQAAEQVRGGGRGDDEVLLHLSPEEYEALTAMWGEPEVNPETGLPEYGFLSKIWKKVKNAVKKVVKSPLFSFLAPIALNVFAPGLGGALGGALGLGAKAAPIVGNTLIRAGTGALSGGKEGALAGALSGLTQGGVGATLGSKLGLSGTAAKLAGDAALGGAGSAISGGDFAEGALGQAMHSLVQPGIEKGVEKGLGSLKHILQGPGTTAPPLVEMGGSTIPGLDEAPLGDTLSVLENLRTGIPTTAEAPLAQAAKSGFGGVLSRAGDYLTDPSNLPKVLAGASMLQAATTGGDEGGAPQDYRDSNNGNSNFGDPLTPYTLDRVQNPSPVLDYYTYGQTGSASPGEAQFFSQNSIPSKIEGSGSTPTPPQQPSAAQQQPFSYQGQGQGALIRALQLQQQGWRLDPNTQTAYPPEPTLHAASGGHTRGPGTGRSDEIEAMLSDGEYVIDAETVSLLGDGSNDAGARRLDEMRQELRRHKGGALSKGQFSPDAKQPMQYLAKGGSPRGISALASKLKALIESYSERPVLEIEAVPDPENPGVSAARVRFSEGDDPVDLIVNENVDDIEMEGIEEVEFSEWPPTRSKSPNPFYATGGRVNFSNSAHKWKKARGGRMRTINAARSLSELLGED